MCEAQAAGRLGAPSSSPCDASTRALRLRLEGELLRYIEEHRELGCELGKKRPNEGGIDREP